MKDNNYKIKRKTITEENVTYERYVAIKVKELREREGLSQAEFAHKLKLVRTSVVNIEKGTQSLTLKSLRTICTEFNIKSSQILPF